MHKHGKTAHFMTSTVKHSVRPLHWTFSTRSNVRGTYHRRLADIGRALRAFGVENLPPNSPAQFAAYYVGCEKLAIGIVGINSKHSAKTAYSSDLHLSNVKEAALDLKLGILETELETLFGKLARANPRPSIAREIRNRMFHDFGPTNVEHAKRHAPRLIPIMKKFLACEQQIQKHLELLNLGQQVADPPTTALKK
jgi:hypothetical protein